MLREDNWCAVEIHFGFGISHRAAAMLTVTTVTSATSTLLQHGHINYITFTLYNCIVQMEFLPRDIRVAFFVKASCDIVALPSLQCMLRV